jgi:hypothetical protein
MMTLAVAKRIQRAAQPTKHEAARIMDSANNYLVRSRSTDSQTIAYSGTQAFVNLADACDILRDARNAALRSEAVIGFDYENQAWVVDGRYVSCGHPETMDCGCFGRIHAGESPAANAEIH